MRRCVIIVEARTDVVILESLLPPGRTNSPVEIKAAGERSAADSRARSVLARGSGDVALVLDARAVDPGEVGERRQFLESSLGQIASRAHWHITLFEPELEVVFFQDRSLLEKLVGHPVGLEDWIRGRYESRKVLEELMGGPLDEAALAQKLAGLNLEPLRNLPQIRELRDFILARAELQAA